MSKILYIHTNSLNVRYANMHQVTAMCNSFANQGHSVVLAVPEIEKANEILAAYFSFYRNIHFEIVFFKVTLLELLERYTFQLKQSTLIKEINPDIIYIRDASFLKAAIKSRKKVLFELHNAKIHASSKLLNLFWTRYVLRASTYSNLHIVVISEELKKSWIKTGISEDKIITAHDGFDRKLFENLPRKEYARKDLSIDKESFVVTYAGSLGKDRKIERIVQLGLKFPKIDFYVLGGTELQVNEYRGLIIEQNVRNVHMMGNLPKEKLVLFLASSDILLAIWSSEVKTINYCSPLKLFEYMAAGVPIIADNFPTIREVVTEGETAILSAPDSIDSLAEKVDLVSKMDDAELKKIGLKARKISLDKYSWDSRVKYILSKV